MRFYLSLIAFFILTLIAFIFGSQNHQLITLNYLVAQSQISVTAAVVLFLMIGFVLGIIATSLWFWSRSIKQRRKRKQQQQSI